MHNGSTCNKALNEITTLTVLYSWITTHKNSTRFPRQFQRWTCSGLRKASSKSSLKLNNSLPNWPGELGILMVFHWKRLSDAKVKLPKIVGIWKQLEGCKKSLSRKKTMLKAMPVAYRRHVWGDLLFNSARTHLIHLVRWKVKRMPRSNISYEKAVQCS